MPLETATTLTDLVTSNPAHTDGLSQADSHMRLLKSTLKATFPNFIGGAPGALQSTQAQLDAAASQSAGTAASVIPKGTAALPGLAILADLGTGIWSPAAGQIAMSLAGAQVLLMGGTALTTSLGVSAAAVTATGAYSGGTGQLVPIGGTLIWWDDVLPTEGGYAWCNGQIIASANTVCPILLARWGTRFGGNGTTTMGVPDLRDTVPVGKSTMGAVASRGLQTLANTVLGTLIGAANYVLTAANIPTITALNSAFGVNVTENDGFTIVSGTSHGFSSGVGGGAVAAYNIANDSVSSKALTSAGTVAASSFSTTSNNTGGAAHSIVQPSTTCNYILRLA